MRRKKYAVKYAKKVAWVCLLFAMVGGGCVKPAVQTGISPTPEVLPTRVDTPTPVPVTVTEVPVPTPVKPTVSPTEKPTETPVIQPTATAEPTREPEVVLTPTSEVLPTDTPTPKVGEGDEQKPTKAPLPTVTVEPEMTATPQPLPTNVPDYVTLLQNGWQRTEDFFGNREIVFSGRFNRTELLATEGRYEYRYTSDTDNAFLFCIIGEENSSVQPFLDELEQMDTECVIRSEGEEDYRYTYTEGGMTVEGRVYACNTEEGIRRMRVELHYPAEVIRTEGHEFYLR